MIVNDANLNTSFWRTNSSYQLGKIEEDTYIHFFKTKFGTWLYLSDQM